MLVKGREVVETAYKEGWAIGAFNVFNLETVQAVFEGAAEAKAPAFIQVSPKALAYAGFEELTELIKLKAQWAKLKTILHLDHAKDSELAKKAIEAGFSSVMFDGSALPFEENVRKTCELVELAHQKSVSVEGELGAIGGKEDYVAGKIDKTHPDRAVEFVQKTGVDYLAVAIGNVHGAKIAGEKLDFELLSEIHRKVDLPLVLHGSSNSTEEEFKKTITLGIAKINIDTELRQTFSGAVKKFMTENPDIFDPREILTPAKDAMKEVVKNRLILFGAARKG